MVKNGLMFELSHPARIGILRLAASREFRHRELVQASGLPPSEVTRHLRRLMESGMMRKDGRGFFGMTRLGTMIFDQMGTLEYVSSNSDYFERHDISCLPAGLNPLSMLRRCSQLTGAMEVLDEAVRINAGAGRGILCIVDDFNGATVGEHVEKARSGVSIRMLVGARRRLPAEYSDVRAFEVSVRACSQTPFFMIANESSAMICLKDLSGRVDYARAFASDSEEFREWCEAVFYHYWDRGRDLTL